MSYPAPSDHQPQPDWQQAPIAPQPMVATPAAWQQQQYTAPTGAAYGRHLAYGQPPAFIAPPPKETKFGKLAWAAIIIGIIGIVGSIIPLLNNLTAMTAGVGLILGVIALFGSRKKAASIGVALCVLAMTFTVMAQKSFSDSIDKSLDSASASDPSSEPASAPATEDGAEPSREAQPDNAGEFDAASHFEKTVKFADGSTLKVGKPVKFRANKYAAPNSPIHVKFKITFTNHSNRALDLSLANATVSAGGEQGDKIYNDMGAPDSKVLPGKSATWWEGAGVQTTEDIQLDVSMGFLLDNEYPDLVFTR